MTGQELLAYQVDHMGYQLSKVFEGIKEEHLDHKACECMMSPRQAVEHLCEVYTAYTTEAAGGKHAWGSYSAGDKSWPDLWAECNRLRGQAVAAAKGAEGEKALTDAYAYIVAHDSYHVGQMATCRISSDPAWDPYSIYQE